MIAKLRQIFSRLVEKGLKENLSTIEFVRGKMINSFILIYAAASVPFFLSRLYRGELSSAMINLFIIIQLLFAYFISTKKGHQKGAIYFLFVLLFFQVMLMFFGVSVTVLFYLASLPILFALLFKDPVYKNLLFFISFLLVLVYYYRHSGSFSLVINYINIIGISYFIISRFVRLTEENQHELNTALEEKQQIIRKLHKRNKELEQLNYITSHDLQEPLKTIHTYSDLLLNKKNNQLDQVSKDGLHFMNQAAIRMTGLIDDIFDHTRISNMSTIGKVNLEVLLEDVKEELKSPIKEKKIRIIQDSLPIVLGYEKELSLLFYSLLSNAIKFSKEGLDSFIKISFESKLEYWQFTIEDNGIGINTEDYGRIFKMFHRLQPKENYTGNGAGLAHCNKIIDLHQGKIWVDSTIGKGSSFHFTIKKSIVQNNSTIANALGAEQLKGSIVSKQ